MKKYILFICLSLIGIQSFSTGDEENSTIGLRGKNKKIHFPTNTAGFKIKELDGYLMPTVTVHLGGMWFSNNAELSVNSDRLGRGTSINLKNDLGINPGAFGPLAEIYFRLGKRHQIVASATGFAKNKSKTLSRDIQFRDSVFHAQASVKAKMHFIAYGLDYRFSIIRTPKVELGLSLGVNLFDIYGSLKVDATQTQVGYSQRKRLYAPAPLPGVHGSIYLTEKLLVRGVFEYFSLNVNDWNFKVYEFKPNLEYYLTSNWGLGVGYSYFSINVSKAPSDWIDGQIKYKLNSTSLFATIRF